MAKMTKQLDLLDYSGAKTITDIIEIANENNRRLQDAYRAIRNDINNKEWLMFTVGMRRWRIGPLQGYHPDKDGKSAYDFVIQELLGGDWRKQSNWQTQHVFHGGERSDF